MLKLKRRGRFLNQKGFTLIELMVVVVILGILAVLVVPKFASQTDKAKEKKTMADLKSMKSALEIYYADNDGGNGKFPLADDSDDDSDDGIVKVLEKYGIKDAKDGFNRSYYYAVSGDQKKFVIFSRGDKDSDSTPDDDDMFVTDESNPQKNEPSSNPLDAALGEVGVSYSDAKKIE